MADRTDAKSAVQTELRIAPYIQTELRLNQKYIVPGTVAGELLHTKMAIPTSVVFTTS